MATYSPGQLSLQDGQLVAKTADGTVVPVSPHDKLVTTEYDYTSVTNPSKRNAGTSPYVQQETPFWQIKDLSKAAGLVKNTRDIDGFGYDLAGNPLALDPRTALLGSEDKSALYGGAYSGDITKYGTNQFRKRDQTRTQVGDFNSKFVQSALKQMYPDATQEQLDEAAYKALTVDDPNAPKIRYRADELRDRTKDVLKNGYGDGRYMPTDIARRIGYFMGGVPEQAEAGLSAWEQQNKNTLLKLQDAVYKYDKSQGTTFKNVAAEMGPLLQIGMGFALPGLGQALGMGALGTGALAGGAMSALSGGDLGDIAKGALLGGAGGALGQYTKGLEGTTAGISNANIGNALGKAGLNIAGGQDVKDALLNAGTSLASSAGSGYLNEIGKDLGLNPAISKGLVNAGLTELRGGDALDSIANSLAGYGSNYLAKEFDIDPRLVGGLTSAALTELRGGDAATALGKSALKYGLSEMSSGARERDNSSNNSQIAALPVDQVSALGDYNVPTFQDTDNYDLMPKFDQSSGTYDLYDDLEIPDAVNNVTPLPEIDEPTFEELQRAGGNGSWTPENIEAAQNDDEYDRITQDALVQPTNPEWQIATEQQPENQLGTVGETNMPIDDDFQIYDPTQEELDAAGGGGYWTPENILDAEHDNLYDQTTGDVLEELLGQTGGYWNPDNIIDAEHDNLYDQTTEDAIADLIGGSGQNGGNTPENSDRYINEDRYDETVTGGTTGGATGGTSGGTPGKTLGDYLKQLLGGGSQSGGNNWMNGIVGALTAYMAMDASRRSGDAVRNAGNRSSEFNSGLNPFTPAGANASYIGGAPVNTKWQDTYMQDYAPLNTMQWNAPQSSQDGAGQKPDTTVRDMLKDVTQLPSTSPIYGDAVDTSREVVADPAGNYGPSPTSDKAPYPNIYGGDARTYIRNADGTLTQTFNGVIDDSGLKWNSDGTLYKHTPTRETGYSYIEPEYEGDALRRTGSSGKPQYFDAVTNKWFDDGQLYTTSDSSPPRMTMDRPGTGGIPALALEQYGPSPITQQQNQYNQTNQQPQPQNFANGGALGRAFANRRSVPHRTGYYKGGTAGTADRVPAMLSHGEYVVPADVVSYLGDGNNEAGARKLDAMRRNTRQHARSAPADKLPPKSKRPEQYMKGVK